MGDTRGEPSMDHILASIKRIINDEGAAALDAARRQKPVAEPEPAADDVLELTEPATPATPPPAETIAAPQDTPEIVSPDTAAASRQSLAALSAVVDRHDPDPGSNTLEGLVREMLRPMLKNWLDANLPVLVEELVSREIGRITGKVP